MDEAPAGLGARDWLFIGAGLIILAGVILYGWGWSLDTEHESRAVFEQSAEGIRRDTAGIRAATANIILRTKLLWWGDRAFALGLVLGVGALIARRR